MQQIAQKIEDMRQVEQWEILHEVYGRIIAWQQVQMLVSLTQSDPLHSNSCSSCQSWLTKTQQMSAIAPSACYMVHSQQLVP